MDDQPWGVLLGAAIASVVPLVTLRTAHAQWRVEKRVEVLRTKKEGLERMYAEVFLLLPAALAERAYPITMMGTISVHASPEFRKLYYDYMDSRERDEEKAKNLLLNLSIASNHHIASIERQIGDLLH